MAQPSRRVDAQLIWNCGGEGVVEVLLHGWCVHHPNICHILFTCYCGTNILHQRAALELVVRWLLCTFIGVVKFVEKRQLLIAISLLVLLMIEPKYLKQKKIRKGIYVLSFYILEKRQTVIIHDVYTKHGFPFVTINAKHRTKTKSLFM